MNSCETIHYQISYTVKHTCYIGVSRLYVLWFVVRDDTIYFDYEDVILVALYNKKYNFDENTPAIHFIIYLK